MSWTTGSIQRGQASFTTNTPSVTLPGTIAANSVLIAIVGGNATFNVTTHPQLAGSAGGFTGVGNMAGLTSGATAESESNADSYAACWYKITDGTEGGKALSVVLDNANADGIIGYIIVPATQTPSLDDVSVSPKSTMANPHTNSVTPSQAGDLIVSLFTRDGPTNYTNGQYTWSTDSGGTITELHDDVGAATVDLGSAYEVLSGSGTVTHSLNLLSVDNGIFYTFAFKETASGGGTTYTSSPSGAVSFVGTPVKQTNKLASGNLASSGALLKQTRRALVGAISFAGALAKQTNKAAAGALTLAGSVTKQTARALAGSLTSSGTLAKTAQKLLAGVLAFAGTAAGLLNGGAQQFEQALSGAITFAGNVTRSTSRSLAGTLPPSSAINRGIAKNIGGAMTFAGTMNRAIRRTLAGAISFVGATLSDLIGPAEATVLLTLSGRTQALTLQARTVALTLRRRIVRLTLRNIR